MRHVQGQAKGKRPLTFMGMFVMVVEAKSKCCWTRMLSLVARWRPARTLWTSLVSRGEIWHNERGRCGEDRQLRHGVKSSVKHHIFTQTHNEVLLWFICCVFMNPQSANYDGGFLPCYPPLSLVGQTPMCPHPVGRCGLEPGHTAGWPSAWNTQQRVQGKKTNL